MNVTIRGNEDEIKQALNTLYRSKKLKTIHTGVLRLAGRKARAYGMYVKSIKLELNKTENVRKNDVKDLREGL